MFAKILGTGRFVPERVLANRDLENMVDTSDEWIRQRTGILERRIAAPEQSLTDMAEASAKAALSDACLDPGSLDLILCSTSTPDYMFPSLASRLQQRIGAPRAACFDISAACTGFLTVLDAAYAYIRAGKYNRILAVAAEKLSDITDYTDRGTCVLFGDAAAAFVLGTSEKPGIHSSFLGCKGEGWEHVTGRTGDKLRMNGREVYKFAVRIMQEAAEGALSKANRRMEEVRWLLPHQANLRIIESAVEKWAIPPDRVLNSIAYTGNTSSAAIPALYDEHRHLGTIRDGDLVLMVAFGAGLTYGAVLYEV